jgi:pimeloyl-ACP methyl ester carboxylesterase
MGAAARSESAALPTRDGAKSAALPVGSRETESEPEADPAIWFVAHSNGAVIALRAAQRLIERGCPVSGLILTGAACEADVLKNRILEWVSLRRLGVAIAYASEDDRVLSGDPAHDPGPARGVISRVRARLWGRLIRPYGCLGRTGWLCGGRPLDGAFGSAIFTRWFPGGHSAYFAPERIHETFERIYGEIIGQGRAAPGERGLPSKAAEPSPTDKEAR